MPDEWDSAALRQPSLYLTVPGRRTGRPHRVSVWFAHDDGALLFLAHARDHGQGTDWYRNLVAAGRATAQIGDRQFEVVHENLRADADPLAMVMELFRAKYGTSTVAAWYQGTRRIPARARITSR